MITVFVFLAGLALGSFLNVCIHRLPKDESIVTPGSHCPECDKAIAWYDNIPVLSYLLLLGRCRSCKGRIPARYPLVEALTALLTTALFLKFGLHPKFFSYAIMSSGLIVATFMDFEHGVIPDMITMGGLAVGLILAFLFPSVVGENSVKDGVLNAAAGALFGGASIFLAGLLGKAMFKKEAMGEGDIWLLAMIGSFLGFRLTLLTFFIAPFFGAIVGIILRLKDGRETIPYGPYLSLGALVSVFFADKIVGLYGF